ncbi:hypothetical protein FPV67DRAFT_1672579 [Lyophyllum atratum]|nr:hypothetical protein FPV67DRAFT_1672579 [Lyophyllum atratum]
MRLFAAVSCLSATLLAVAQSNPIVLVGSTSDAPGGIFQFIPPSINATNGTTITFRFTGAPGNHSITQSSFTNPCTPSPGGFDSGWVFIPTNNVSTAPEWNLTVTNTTTREATVFFSLTLHHADMTVCIALWFYCKQLVPLTHCSAGMVGAINAPPTGNLTFDNYKANAQAFQGPSGQGEGSLVGHGASASAGPGPAVSGAQFYTGAPAASGTAPSSPSGSGSAAPTSGAAAMTVSTFVVALGVVAGAFVGYT